MAKGGKIKFTGNHLRKLITSLFFEILSTLPRLRARGPSPRQDLAHSGPGFSVGTLAPVVRILLFLPVTLLMVTAPGLSLVNHLFSTFSRTCHDLALAIQALHVLAAVITSVMDTWPLEPRKLKSWLGTGL